MHENIMEHMLMSQDCFSANFSFWLHYSIQGPQDFSVVCDLPDKD